MSDNERLAWKMKKAAIVRKLELEGRITDEEYQRWVEEIKQPNTLWGWISWRVFGL